MDDLNGYANIALTFFNSAHIIYLLIDILTYYISSVLVLQNHQRVCECLQPFILVYSNIYFFITEGV